jgi:hypothetical protein
VKRANPLRTVEKWLGIAALDRSAHYAVEIGRALALSALFLSILSGPAWYLLTLGDTPALWQTSLSVLALLAPLLGVSALGILAIAKFVYGPDVCVRRSVLMAAVGGFVAPWVALVVVAPMLA